MNTLDYRGIKSTRFGLMLLLIFLGSLFFSLNLLSQNNWIELIKWIFGIYSSSEGVAKAATAYREKNNNVTTKT